MINSLVVSLTQYKQKPKYFKCLQGSNVLSALSFVWRFFLLKVLLYKVYILLCNIKYSFFNYSESAPVSGFIRIQSGGRLQLTMRGEDIKGEEESPPRQLLHIGWKDKARKKHLMTSISYHKHVVYIQEAQYPIHTHTLISWHNETVRGVGPLSLVGKRFFVFCFCFIFFSRVTL